jgi:beta-lactamase superfamily II metal-dependent hydrolase
VRTVIVVLSVLFVVLPPTAKTPEARLSIYVIDVEGGNSTLIVSPSGESLLIDTGHLNAAVRDSGRIMEALKDANVSLIDHLVTTHWHTDHFGGMAELAHHVPIREFIDHGPNTQPKPEADDFLQNVYPVLYQTGKHLVVKPGDSITMKDLSVKVVTSAGATLQSPLPDAGPPNPYCDDFRRPDPDRTENAQSIGLHIKFGQFRALHLGDLPAEREFELMCPANRIGTVDLFVVSHHGQERANSKPLVHAIEPRAAIMNNGLRKGGAPEVMTTIYSAPGLESLWQLHFSVRSGQQYAAPGVFIANLSDAPQPTVPVAPMTVQKGAQNLSASELHNGKAYWIRVSARSDGFFTITNQRTQFTKDYPVRQKPAGGKNP